MRKITREEVNLLIPRKEQKSFHLPPDFDQVEWDQIEFLGWIHRSGHKGYVLENLDGKPRVWVFDCHRADPSAKGAVMCDICCSVRRSRQKVVMFTSPVRGAENVTRGFRACADLRCSANIKEASPDGMRETISLEDKRARILANLGNLLAAFERR